MKPPSSGLSAAKIRYRFMSTSRNLQGNDGRRSGLLPPRRERVVEGALAGGALFDGDDGAALVDIDQRHIEPGALLQELQVARAVGLSNVDADRSRNLQLLK